MANKYECIICTDIINVFLDEWLYCLFCNERCCMKCHKYGMELNVFSESSMCNYFYCSIVCMLSLYKLIPDGFNQFLNKVQTDEHLFNKKIYTQSQEHAYTEIISPQIKKIIGEVGLINDLCDVVCEFL